jgi:hypothetical protein
MQVIRTEQQAVCSKHALVRVRAVLCGLAFAIALVSIALAQQTVSVTERPIAEAFANPIQRVNAAQGALSIPVEWVYTNHWSIPLLAERIDSSCGCLAAQIDHQQIAPGATGILRATLTPGALRGVLRKSLSVRFVGFSKPVEISVETTIPSSVSLSQQQLRWPSSGSLSSSETQIIDVTSMTDKSFAITGLLGLQESQFTIVQKTITPGKHYQLHITPANPHPAGALSAALQIRTNSPDPRDQVLILLMYQASAHP